MYNRELQFIDTQEKAYLLGLFYSDGYVSTKANACAITLHAKDLYLLEKLKQIFPFFKTIKSHANAYKFLCVNKDLKIDLLANGVYTQKSSTNRELLKIPNINEKLLHHFIRGYFDGDGSVYKQKIANIKIEIGGTSFNFITNIIKVLYDNKINVNLHCKYAGSGLRTLDYYLIYTSSYKESKLFANFIYKDSNIHLIRKFELLNLKIEEKPKIRHICPKCGSNETIYNGFRNNKIRIKCKNCNKMSSITAPDSSNVISGGDELLEA